MTLPAKNILGNLNVLRDDFASAIEDQRDQVAFLGTLWEPDTPYIHPCATIGSDGQRYYSMQSSTGQDPTIDIVNAYWVLEMENASNSNGEYWRFWDGLQICRSPNINVGALSVAMGSNGLYRSVNTTWTFPAEFSEFPTFNPFPYPSSPVVPTGVWCGFGTGQNRSNASFVCIYSSPIVDRPIIAKCVSIGRWY